MFFAGIDAHTRYVVVVIINSAGARVAGPTRVSVREPEQLLARLAPYRPLDAVVETSSSWPWLHELLTGAGVTFVLAHARRLRAIAEANYKRDALDAELLARLRLAGLIPVVYPTPFAQREWATLLRHRAPPGARTLCRDAADHALSDAGPSGELRRARPDVDAVWHPGGAPRRDSRRGESLAARGAGPRGRLARAACARQLAHALLRGPEGAPRLAHGARRGGAQAGARHSRHAAHADAVDQRTARRDPGSGSG